MSEEGVTSKIKKWLVEEENDENEEFDLEPMNMNKPTMNKDSQLILFEPSRYSDAQDIAVYLKQNKATIVNLHHLQKEQSKRVTDFLSGVVFAIDGDIQKIGPRIFLCTPRNIKVGGIISTEDQEG